MQATSEKWGQRRRGLETRKAANHHHKTCKYRDMVDGEAARLLERWVVMGLMGKRTIEDDSRMPGSRAEWAPVPRAAPHPHGWFPPRG